jgi:hypothetical protein
VDFLPDSNCPVFYRRFPSGALLEPSSICAVADNRDQQQRGSKPIAQKCLMWPSVGMLETPGKESKRTLGQFRAAECAPAALLAATFATTSEAFEGYW